MVEMRVTVMIFKKISFVALAMLSLVRTAMAGEAPPAMVTSYYNMRVKNEPSGVYEWAEQDLLFVQVRIPEATGDAAEEMEGRVLLAEHKELFAWLAQHAAKDRKDPQLSPGMERMRRFVREELPLWEYDANWKYSFNGPHLTRHEIGERVCCAVCKKSEVLATMPSAFLKPVGEDTWIRGGKGIVRDKYPGKADRLFMWQIGLLDALALSLENGKSLDAWVNEFGTSDNAAYLEFKKVGKDCERYLAESETARFFASEKLRLETLPDKISYEWDKRRPTMEKSVEAHTVTNKINETEFEVVVTEREVRRNARILHKVVTKMAVDPKFEKLFLSGGSMENVASERTALGLAAEKQFYENGGKTFEQREKFLIDALRENPGDKVLWNLLGRMMMIRQDWHGGLVCMRNALRLDREYAFALTNVAIIYHSLGFDELAFGAAIAVMGVTDDAWCKKEAEKLIRGDK